MKYTGLKLFVVVIGFLELVLGFLVATKYQGQLPQAALGFFFMWLAVSFVSNIFSLKEFSVAYLLSFFSYLVASRILALYFQDNLYFFMALIFLIFLLQFFYCVFKNKSLSINEWQLVFVRIYIAFDFIPHFTEKLFAGYKIHYQDVEAFQALHLPYSNFLVYMAGCCELGAAIGLGLGIFTRLSAALTTVYLLIATYLGKHFLEGFIWCGPHGGWEFAILWSAIIFSFAITDAHGFSVDEFLQEHKK